MKKNWVSAITVLCAVLCVLAVSCGTPGGSGAPVATWDWLVNGDADNGGSSTIDMAEGTQEGVPAYKFTGNITNDYEYGFVNVKAMPDIPTLENLKNAKAISFRVLGDGEKYAVKITTSDVADYAYFEYYFDTEEGVPMSVIAPVDQFMQPAWGKSVTADGVIRLENALFIEYQTTRNGSPGPYEFSLWDLRVWTDKIPTEKQVYSGKPAKAPKAAAAKGPGGDLGAFSAKLNDNFQYGDGYQFILSDKRLFNGHKVAPGEVYTLKITYTTSRDLEGVVNLGIVDTTPNANYWRPLSWSGGDDMAEIPQSKAGEVVTARIVFKIQNSPTSATGPANALCFQTSGEGKPGVAQSGVKKAVTFDFTQFVFLEGEQE